jgi:cytochrome P450
MTAPAIDIDFASDDLDGDRLHEVLRRARDLGPVVSTRFAGTEAFLLTRYETLRSYLGDQEHFPGEVVYQFSTRPSVGSTFIDMGPPQHDAYRQLAMPAFRSRAVSRFVESDLTPLAHEVLDRLAPAGSGDLSTGFAQVLPYWAISRKLGLPRGSEEQQRAWAAALLSYPSDPGGASRAADEVAAFLAPTVAARRAAPSHDVISQLATGEFQGTRLTDDEIVAHVRLLYAVGATTTSDGMSTLLWRVLTSPDLLDRARTEPEVLPRLVHESLRTEPPVAVLPRLAPAGGQVAGVELPPMALVLCAVAAANRDPEVFSDPDRFDPDRAEAEIITFGFGTKFCPGSHLARQQLLAGLDAVLHRLPGLRVVDAGRPVNAVLRRVEHLGAVWDPVGDRG